MNKLIWSFIILVAIYLQEIGAMCPYECSCENEPTNCPIGVRLTMDGCSCCKICTRQQGQTCDIQNICDSEMGLVCDFASNQEQGICKVQVGQSCSYNGRTYLNGEMFQPTCKHQCWCMDGTVGCLTMCPHETRVPQAKECPNARLEVADNECCERWMCGKSDHTWELPLDKFWDKYVDKNTDTEASEAVLPGNELLPSPTDTTEKSTVSNNLSDTGDESDLNRNPFYHSKSQPSSSDYYMNAADDSGGDGDEIIDYQMAQVLLQKGGVGLRDWFGDDIMEDNMYEYDNWAISNDVVGDVDARRRNTQSKANCAVQTTSWSPCSKTCGLGLATRVTNNNRECKLRRESRLCNIRPCDNTDYVIPKRGKHCTKQRREHKRTHFKYSNCVSVRAYRPRYCGGCDDGRCCTPLATRTVRIRFRCEKGEYFVKSMLMIRSCRCHYNCSAYTVNSFLVSRDLHDDMHVTNEP
uniref:CCN family member 1-like n=1 Tax=Styela clava TaxID=7725 RepID=UPI00193ACF62|nr:CCN family member 1-like [Styela clava]